MTSAHAGPHLEVHGASRFDARGSHAGGGVAVSATLLDDAEHPIGGATVAVRFTATADGSSLPARPCGAETTAAGDAIVAVTTSPDGTLCVRADRPSNTRAVTARLVFSGTQLMAGADTTVSIDLARVGVELTLDPLPRGPVAMTIGEGDVTLDAVATTDDPAVSPQGLLLHLTDEHKTRLADATTDKRGVARFSIPDATLALPGPGTLHLTFDGDPRHANAAREIPCERRVHVLVRPRETTADGRARGDETERGVVVDLDVTTTRGAPAPGGSVEGFVDGAVVGAAPVASGHARLTVSDLVRGTPKSRDDGPRFTARYVPDVPWYVAGTPAVVELHVTHTLLKRRLGVLAVGLAIFAWFFLSRSRFYALPKTAPRVSTGPGAVDAARMDVLAPHADGRTSWEGQVVDAHDGEAIRGALLHLERAGFASLETVATATTDEHGRFVLDAPDGRAGDQIAVEAELHQRLVRPAPARGVVAVALVSRRRGLLRRLVEWAHRRGPQLAPHPEPTPGQVRRARADAGDEKMARWAGAVEGAAFGHAEVDAKVEAEIDGLGHETDERSGDAE